MIKFCFHHKKINNKEPGVIYIDNSKSTYDHRMFSEIAGYKALLEMLNEKNEDGTAKYDDNAWISLNQYRREFDDRDVYDRTCIPQPMILPTSVAGHYSIYHNLDDLILCGQALKEEFPHFVQGFEQVINGNVFIPYNMAILTVNQFRDYSAFLLKILDNFHKKIGTETYEDRLDYIKRYPDKYTGEYKNNDVAYQARIESFCAERISSFYWLYVSRQMPVFPCKVNLMEENQKI